MAGRARAWPDAALKTASPDQDGPAGVKWRGQEPNKRGVNRESRGARFLATQNATQFRLIASSCSPGRWSSWRAWGFRRQRGRQYWQGSRPTGHLRMVALPNYKKDYKKAMIPGARFTANLSNPWLPFKKLKKHWDASGRRSSTSEPFHRGGERSRGKRYSWP